VPYLADAIHDAESILNKYKSKFTETFAALVTREPENDWSSVLWRLIHECAAMGMTEEETFVITWRAPCNKYRRDDRPPEHLWRDILKAYDGLLRTASYTAFDFPALVDGPDSRTFVDEYREWAMHCTDAVPDFHNLCCLVGLSAIVSASVKLEVGNVESDQMTPNLWGMLLGDSTLTRKTTAMRFMTDFLINMDRELIIASDSTQEGLLAGIAERPNKASIFYRDEISGLFDAMSRKEYMAGFQEVLTALYDSPKVYLRKLSKQTVVIEQPSFIFLGGGVPSRVYASIGDFFVLSGFLPRFLVSYGEADLKSRKPLGPPSESSIEGRPRIFNKLADLYETYGMEVEAKIGGQKVTVPQRYIAKPTPEAWDRYNELDKVMMREAIESSGAYKDLALPTFDRLSKSMLKIAVILAAIRQRPKASIVAVEEGDMINAAYYIQPWGQNAIKLMTSAGKGSRERLLEKVYDLIEGNPGIFKGEIMRKLHLHTKEATELLQTLEERGMVRKERHGKGYRYWAQL
jgi:predicted transcriptional regulator